MKFREHHLRELLGKIRSESTHLDVLLRHYFRNNKALGSKDRAWVSETLYHYIRWKNLYDTLKLDPIAPLPATTDLSLALKLGTPQKLIDILTAAYGAEKTAEICQINQTRAPITLRANLLKISRDDLLQKLQPQLELVPTDHSPWGINCGSKVNFAALSEFQEGLFEVQDEASQLGAALVHPLSKQQILDYCAGAGGKSLAVAPLMRRSGQLYLHDIRPQALLEAKKRLRRGGIQNAQFNLPPKKKSMDWVMVDVPCSGTGTYRRNPDLKWKFEAIDLPCLIQEQRNIFDQALHYLHPHGTIVYMTCSILPEENEQQTDFFQKKYSLQVVEKFQTLPLLKGMDGFFAVSLRKTSRNHEESF
jgi:16S rRNA (cytosine967-C5)-methyltransferase